MRRTKEWWARLSPGERSRLVWLERSANRLSSHSAYLPDDCTECPSCGDPQLGSELCAHCDRELIALVKKAAGEELFVPEPDPPLEEDDFWHDDPGLW